MSAGATSEAFVPGRANLIGEHTDYNGGLALAVALELGVRASVRELPGPDVEIVAEGYGTWRSDRAPEDEWSRQGAAVIAALGATSSSVRVTSTLPAGVGLSSSAAYVGALLLALGADGSLRELAELVRACEAVAGHEVGLLDPLSTLGARAACGLLIDFATLEVTDVALPDSLGLTAVHSGLARSLAASQYAQRRAECSEAARLLGGWSDASDASAGALADPVLARRASHVVGENRRVREVVDALGARDVAEVGRLVSTSHASLRDLFEVSLPAIDRLVEALIVQPGVYGARLVGGGFGGCVLVVHDPSRPPSAPGHAAWSLRAGDGALARLGRAR
jgi:galactokinase